MIEEQQKMLATKRKRDSKREKKVVAIKRVIDNRSTEDYSEANNEEVKQDIKLMHKNLLQSFGSVEGLTCAICLDFIVDCSTAVCGHSFCR